jgi:hypothetical protein
VVPPVLVTPPPVDEPAAAEPVVVPGPAPVEVEVTARPVLEPAEVEEVLLLLLLLPQAASALAAKARKAIFVMGYPFRAAADWRIEFGESLPRPWFVWPPNKLPMRADCKSRSKESFRDCRAWARLDRANLTRRDRGGKPPVALGKPAGAALNHRHAKPP